MPSICYASRCFNTSDIGYALVRFPKEDTYRKAWSDAVGENMSQPSLDNLRSCEVSTYCKNGMQNPNKNNLKNPCLFPGAFRAVRYISSRESKRSKEECNTINIMFLSLLC